MILVVIFFIPSRNFTKGTKYTVQTEMNRNPRNTLCKSLPDPESQARALGKTADHFEIANPFANRPVNQSKASIGKERKLDEVPALVTFFRRV